jgi:hypothetical protein
MRDYNKENINNNEILFLNNFHLLHVSMFH